MKMQQVSGDLADWLGPETSPLFMGIILDNPTTATVRWTLPTVFLFFVAEVNLATSGSVCRERRLERTDVRSY